MFSKQLQKLLKQRGVSVAHLARESRISSVTLYKYLEGRSPRKLEHVRSLCLFFDVSSDFLLFGIENKAASESELVQLGNYDVFLKKSKKARS